MIEPAQEGLQLARLEALERALQDHPRLAGPTGASERMDVGRDDLGVVGLGVVRRPQPGQGALGLSQRDIEQVPEVVRVPGISGRRRDRLLVGLRGAPKIPEQRLAEGKDRPGAVIVAGVREGAAGIDGGPPGMALHEQLRELAMREHAVVARRWREPREPRQSRQNVGRIECTPKRALDLLT